MENKWTVRSVNGTENGQEGEWKSIDQIQGSQTRLINNLFGIAFRIIPVDKDSYVISEIKIDRNNEYLRLMKEAGIDIGRVCEDIKNGLDGRWTETNVKGFMDYGVIEGIATKLELKDAESKGKTNYRGEFLSNSDIEVMRNIEWDEYYYFKNLTNEKKVQNLESVIKGYESRKEKLAEMLMCQKYRNIIEREAAKKTYGANSILDYMKKHNFTVQDLSMALAMAQATRTGVREAKGHIIDEKTKEDIKDKDETTLE